MLSNLALIRPPALALGTQLQGIHASQPEDFFTRTQFFVQGDSTADFETAPNCEIVPDTRFPCCHPPTERQSPPLSYLQA